MTRPPWITPPVEESLPHMSFDEMVRAIREVGIRPKCTAKKKWQCTPEEWAAHREYMKARYADPVCRAMHQANQIKYLCKKR